MTFGERFGQLIRQKRELEGITAGELARRVWKDEARRSRISDLENGKVKRPQAKTVQALCDYLDISLDEMDACRQPSQATPSDTATSGIDLPKELLENLAQRFGHDNPDLPPDKLTAFLKEKANDYHALQTRLTEMTRQDDRLGNLLAAVKTAMDGGDFDQADTLLADAEEIQLEHKTLVEIRKQSDMRMQRGHAALFKGDAERAAQLFTQAAGFFEPFDTNEDAQTLHEGFMALYQHGLRYGGTALAHAIEGAKKEINLRQACGDKENCAAAQNNLAIALAYQAARVAGDEGAQLLAQAVKAYEAALTVYTKAGQPLKWAMTQNNLAIALADQAARVAGDEGAQLLAQAVKAYEAALTVYTKADQPLDWAMTQNNLATALADQAARVAGDEGAQLLAQAVKACEAALTVYTIADQPLDWATTQNNLATALADQAARVAGDEGAQLLAQAVKVYEAALTVRTKADQPLKWAMTQENLGLAFENRAEMQPDTARKSLETALQHFDRALEIFDPVHLHYNHDKASTARARVAAKLEALEEGE